MKISLVPFATRDCLFAFSLDKLLDTNSSERFAVTRKYDPVLFRPCWLQVLCLPFANLLAVLFVYSVRPSIVTIDITFQAAFSCLSILPNY